MKTFKFISIQFITAKNEKEAKRIFADNSHNFAADADIIEIGTNNQAKKEKS